MLTVTDTDIIRVYFRNRHGVRGAARILGIPISRVCRVVLTYKRHHEIR